MLAASLEQVWTQELLWRLGLGLKSMSQDRDMTRASGSTASHGGHAFLLSPKSGNDTLYSVPEYNEAGVYTGLIVLDYEFATEPCPSSTSNSSIISHQVRHFTVANTPLTGAARAHLGENPFSYLLHDSLAIVNPSLCRRPLLRSAKITTTPSHLRRRHTYLSASQMTTTK